MHSLYLLPFSGRLPCFRQQKLAGRTQDKLAQKGNYAAFPSLPYPAGVLLEADVQNPAHLVLNIQCVQKALASRSALRKR